MKKVYPKNSFDRFGDDLTELIVSYLWFEDKVRLECVSKQWRRLVFNKQFAIELNSNQFLRKNKNSLKMIGLLYRGNQLTIESVLKKCSNQGWLKSAILGRGSSYKDFIFFGLKSRGGFRLGRNFDISLISG